MRVLASIAIAVVFASANALAQTTTSTPTSAPTNTPPDPAEESDDKAWSFAASAYTYIVPDSRDYVQPTFTADRGWLHFEERYNYEALDTASVWLGYNFSGGEILAWVGDRLGRHRGAARALRRQVGGDGDHRAGGRVGLGLDPHDRRASTATTRCSTARRSTSPPASAPTSSSSGRRSTAEGPRGDQVLHRRALESGHEAHRLEHKLGIRASDTAAFILDDCRVPKEDTARQPRGRRQAGLRRRRCRRSTTPARWSPRWRSVSRALARRTRLRLAEAGVEVDYSRPALSSPPPPRASSRWRPTTRRRGC